jgi:transcription initiation factor TFIIIB Brf1 subunit/transcription initiation factor TFIIB
MKNNKLQKKIEVIKMKCPICKKEMLDITSEQDKFRTLLCKCGCIVKDPRPDVEHALREATLEEIIHELEQRTGINVVVKCDCGPESHKKKRTIPDIIERR